MNNMEINELQKQAESLWHGEKDHGHGEKMDYYPAGYDKEELKTYRYGYGEIEIRVYADAVWVFYDSGLKFKFAKQYSDEAFAIGRAMKNRNQTLYRMMG